MEKNEFRIFMMAFIIAFLIGGTIGYIIGFERSLEKHAILTVEQPKDSVAIKLP